MTAGKYNFTIEAGATLSKTFTWKDSAGALINLTGYTARMQIRRLIDSDSTLLNLTTENSGITLGGVLGTITLNATAVQTASLSGKGVYDLELVSSGGAVTRLLKGEIDFSLNVTR